MEKENLLSSYRALDLTDEKGMLCGKILGDLGADVIKIEKPGGDPARNIGPFYHDIPDPEKSLFWFAYNTSKRGITLNIETSDGRDIFKRLVRTADFVIESFPPGYMDELGLGYSVLSEVNPRIILTSISGLGQTGPYMDRKVPDIVAWAMGGMMYLTGDPDRPPLQMSPPQAYLHAAADAASATMIALYHRELTGEGQHIDVSAQESVIWALMGAQASWDLQRVNAVRQGGQRVRPDTRLIQRLTWHCKDGYVCMLIRGGQRGAASMHALVKWMDNEGMADEHLKTMEWETLDYATCTQENFDRIAKPIERFFQTHTKAELFQGAVERRVILYPVSDIKDAIESQQLAARNFWEKVEHPELGEVITYPGTWVRASGTACRIWRRAPLIGEHNEELYEKELGLSRAELIILKQDEVI